ncbi:MAG: thioredoxin family protein [Anaerovoracaceae bacterium]
MKRFVKYAKFCGLTRPVARYIKNITGVNLTYDLEFRDERLEAIMKAMDITKDKFEKLRSESMPVLVEFWAPWCTYCKRLGPTVDMIADDYEGNVIVAKVDIDKEPALAEAFEIETIPSMILFKDEAVSEVLVNPPSKVAIAKWLKERGIEK